MRKFLPVSFTAVGFAALSFTLAACGVGPDAISDGVDSTVESDVDVLGETGDALTTSNRASVWFPIQSGNTWNFASASGATKTVKLQNVGSNMAMVSGLLPDDVWVGMSSTTSTTLEWWDTSKSDWAPFIRFNYPKATWTFGSGACSTFKAVRTGTGVDVNTPAGVFNDTRVISLTLITQPNVRCGAPAIRELSFAANVGLVSFTTGGNVTYSLTSATIAGKPVPSDSASATLSLDKTTYSSKANTIRCVTTPCPSNAVTAVAKAKFTVKNDGVTPMTWQFSSGCQYDIDIVSASGTVVKRLSTEQMCTAALTKLVLNPGQSKVFNAEIELDDRDALQLEGQFTMVAKLTSTNQKNPSASKAFSVTVR